MTEPTKKMTFDVLSSRVTACDQAASESCPISPVPPKKLHWSTPDPAQVDGSEMGINTAFEVVFNPMALS